MNGLTRLRKAGAWLAIDPAGDRLPAFQQIGFIMDNCETCE